MTHYLKTLKCHFEHIRNGDKPFEIRRNDDRGFQKGDMVIFEEFDNVSNRITGRTIEAKITYVTNFRQAPEMVVFGVKF